MKPRYFIAERLIAEARMAPRVPGPLEIEARNELYAYLARQYERTVIKHFVLMSNPDDGADMLAAVRGDGTEQIDPSIPLIRGAIGRLLP